MISAKLKDLQYYRSNKRKFNRKYNYIWKKIAGPEYLGLCSYIFQTFYYEWNNQHPKEKPTCQDFANYYFSHVNHGDDETSVKLPNSTHYGRTVAQLYRLAEHFKTMCNDDKITIEEFYDDVVNHGIVETFNGQMREIMVKERYEKFGYTVEPLNGTWDKDFGVDSLIRNSDGEIVDYIQCKPVSTFLGTKNESLIADRKLFYNKEEAKKKECKRLGYPYLPTRFILYNDRYPDKWCCIGDKKSFLLEDLCDKQGMPLHEKNDFEYFSQ